MKPYYEQDGIALYHGDARELLPLFGAHACVTDPPYGSTSLRWDRWVSGWLGLVRSNTLWCFGTFRMFLDRGTEFGPPGWKLAQDLVWEKHNGSSPASDRFKPVHELIVHWYRGDWAEQLQQTPITHDSEAHNGRGIRRKRPPHWGEIDQGAFETRTGGPRLARSVQRFRSEHGTAEHPTQKPAGLVRLLLEYSTAPGHTVIDPFCGSGTTLLAAKQLGRRAIGFDADERWCEVTARRLAQELPLAESRLA